MAPKPHQADGEEPHGGRGHDGPLQGGPELPEASPGAGTAGEGGTKGGLRGEKMLSPPQFGGLQL